MPDSNDSVLAHVKLSVGGVDLETRIPVPKGPRRARDLLPIFRAFSNAFENTAVGCVEELGQKVSCQKGCGACCRQLVPVALSETYMLRDLVESFPEPRRSEVLRRFAEARGSLEKAGFLDRLREPGRLSEEGAQALSDDYFALRIPCPFLEEESCSIHAERPMRCREYLVTSDPAHCAVPTPQTVRMVPLPAKTSVPVMRLDDDASDPYLRWVPLPLALEYASAHQEPAPLPATELFSHFLTNLGKQPEYAR